VGVRHKRYVLTGFERAVDDQIFICHTHEDRPFVEDRLVKPLRELKIKTWYCVDDIKAGNAWVSAIRHALSQSTWIAVVISKNAVNSAWMRIEMDTAMALEKLRDRIIPIGIDETPYKEVNEFLAAKQGLNVKSSPNLAEKLATLVRSRA
jgi:hypothetical protein